MVDVLLGSAPTGTALQSHQQLPLRVLGAGMSVRPRPEVIESREFNAFIDELRNTFDLVVLDCSPVLAVSVATLISRVADWTVLAVAWRSTPQDLVDEAVSTLRRAGAPLTGIAFTKVDVRRAVKYGAYHYSYPGYDQE